MTREEAIAKIKRKACFGGYNNKNLCQWADEGFGKCEECENYMAIKALEQQPCDDCVRREDVLMALTGDVTDCTVEEYIARLREKLSKLPSVGKDINVTTNDDCISRQAVLALPTSKTRTLSGEIVEEEVNIELIKALPSVTPKEKIGYCKDCKWWKDNDGVYRRGVGAESKCPINRKEVYEGNGYCFMFEPQESENKE